MEIIQHGDTVSQITCKHCGCIFTYSKSDIERDDISYAFHFTNNEDYQFFVRCPECLEMQTLEKDVG